MRTGRRVIVALAFVLLSLGIAVPAGAADNTALRLEIPAAPKRVHGSDGREHINYDLVITNGFSSEVTLTSVTVSGGGRRLLRLAGAQLANFTHQTLGTEPTTTIPASSTVATLIDVALPRSARRRVPKRLTTRIDYAVPPDAPLRAAIGSTTVRRTSRVDRRRPIVVASPMRGPGWFSANGCCGDPTSPHRSLLLAADGWYVTPEMFAIDYIQVVGGRLYRGDGSQNSDYFAEGAPIHAATGGTVVSTIDNRPEVPPGESPLGNPTVRKPVDFGGNTVVIRVRRGIYAAYAHMQPGSVRVRRGQQVRRGQVIGRLGNSGNTSAPHLHFGIQDGPDILTSNSLPFEVDRYRLLGMAGPDSTPTAVTIGGTPRSERGSYPLIGAVATYAR
jgi:Peptidase family M23